ncbi:UNVERIFIED_CONTAM: Pentatricopeptide repeat-containing protein [Sesamum calycinum]|uniref:Pentatricopeptide repeat-containing protein n=1 Tax=Sesamum calycinum TaxID=2727403 RepID=A0AAW2LVG2_9LAMI
MAINFPAKLQLLGSVHDRELCKPKVPNRKEARKSSGAIAFQSINERTRVVGGKLFEIGANYEYSQKTHVQELVDQLHSCADKGLLTETRIIHGYLLKSDFDDDNLLKLLNHVIYAYFKCSDFESAKIVFDYLPRTNVFSWSVMIAGFNQQASFRHGDVVHGQIIVRGFGSHVVVSTALLNMYAKLGKVEEAYRVFNSMAEINDVSWNAMISGLTANGLHLEAFDHFMQMKEQGFVPNMYTLVSVLKAVGMLGHVDKGKRVHECVSELGMQENILVGTALIDMYSRCGHLLEARSVFDMNFAECGVNGPWNAMITGYTLCNCSRQALELVLKSGPDLMNLSVENAIADAYSKCGCLEEVKKILNRMKCRDIVSWTTLVTCYSQCSRWEDALLVFSQMREEGFTPNNFTLASVLTACANLCYLEYGRQIHGLLFKLGFETVRYIESALIDMYAKGGSIKRQRSHAGLVKEGLQYFWSMEKSYGLVPEMEHYASVVDLLGRVGRLNEAFEFIMKMPIEPDEMVWQTLLAACRIHGNIEFGSYKDGVDLRKVMKEQGVRKEPGYSWISVKGKVHRFYAGDTDHPQKDAIYAILEELRRKMKNLGYVPDLKYALQGED